MPIKIGQHLVGENQPVFIVAEISGNHNGQLDSALELVHCAKRAGANAIKLQTYTPDTITLNSDKPDFVLTHNSPWADYGTLWNVYNHAYTPWEWHEALFNEAKKIGLEYFSSPFDHTAVDFLDNLDVCAFKIASPEINDIPLLKKVSATKKPVIVSTGIASKEDLDLAVTTLRETGCEDIILLKCTTAYPTPLKDMNLSSIPMIRDDYDINVGLSDHSLGIVAPIMAVTMGAVLVEKHIKQASDDHTVDSDFSSSEDEFRQMCQAIRETNEALGEPTYNLAESVKLNFNGGRSLYVTEKISKGEVFSEANIASVRPGYGIHTKYYDIVIGSKSTQDLSLGDRLTWDVIDIKKAK